MRNFSKRTHKETKGRLIYQGNTFMKQFPKNDYYSEYVKKQTKQNKTSAGQQKKRKTIEKWAIVHVFQKRK